MKRTFQARCSRGHEWVEQIELGLGEERQARLSVVTPGREDDGMAKELCIYCLAQVLGTVYVREVHLDPPPPVAIRPPGE